MPFGSPGAAARPRRAEIKSTLRRSTVKMSKTMERTEPSSANAMDCATCFSHAGRLTEGTPDEFRAAILTMGLAGFARPQQQPGADSISSVRDPQCTSPKKRLRHVDFRDPSEQRHSICGEVAKRVVPIVSQITNTKPRFRHGNLITGVYSEFFSRAMEVARAIRAGGRRLRLMDPAQSSDRELLDGANNRQQLRICGRAETRGRAAPRSS